MADLHPFHPAQPHILVSGTASIENWRVLKLGGTGPDRLYGTIYGHRDPAMPDGTQAYTSGLVLIDRLHGVAYTQNTRYTLGEEAR